MCSLGTWPLNFMGDWSSVFLQELCGLRASASFLCVWSSEMGFRLDRSLESIM